MDDLINRQAAIEALCSVCGVDCDKSKFVYDGKQEDQVILCPEHYALTQLPSARPEKRTKKRTETHACDCISRQAAIDAICDNCDHVEAVCPHYPCKQYIAIENLPPAQPEIIRCKDCKYSRFFDPNFYCYEHGNEMIVSENGFCYLAERRKND